MRPWLGVVSSSRPRGLSTRLTSESQRAVSPTCSITSLAHTSVESAVGERQRPADRHQREAQLGVGTARALKRSLSHLGADHLRTRPCEYLGEYSRPRPEVEHSLIAPHPIEQEALAKIEVRRLEFVRERLPEVFEVLLHGDSTSNVTGPSATSSIAIIAPNTPRLAPSRSQKRSYSGAACSPAAARVKLGRLPRRASP